MAKEAYVSFETVKLLKKNGMDKECFTHYIQKNNSDGTSEAVTTCTQQMAMRWLREIHNIFIGINPYLPEIMVDGNHTGLYENMTYSYSVDMWGDDGWHDIQKGESLSDEYHTYEDAGEAALKYALENLI